MTSASPSAGTFHWSLFRATCPSSAPCSPAAGSYTNGSIVARSPCAVGVTRSAAPWWVSRSPTSASSAAKCAGMYIVIPPVTSLAVGAAKLKLAAGASGGGWGPAPRRRPRAPQRRRDSAPGAGALRRLRRPPAPSPPLPPRVACPFRGGGLVRARGGRGRGGGVRVPRRGSTGDVHLWGYLRYLREPRV